MLHRYNHLGDIISVIDEMVVGVNADSGESIIVEKVNEELTAELTKPENLRQNAYRRDLDPIRDRAVSYQVEADGWRLEGEEEKALAAEANAAKALREYVAKKTEIRERIPNSPTAEKKYYLTKTGTYHADGCGYISNAAGEWLTLAAIAAVSPDAKSCGRCNPPALS